MTYFFYNVDITSPVPHLLIDPSGLFRHLRGY